MRNYLLIILVSLVCFELGFSLGASEEQSLSRYVEPTFVYKGKLTSSAQDSDSVEKSLGVDRAILLNRKEKYSIGLIPDAKTAYHVSYPILCAIYGEDVIKRELPLKICLVNERFWHIEGTLHATHGGVASMTLDKTDGRVLVLFHTK